MNSFEYAEAYFDLKILDHRISTKKESSNTSTISLACLTQTLKTAISYNINIPKSIILTGLSQCLDIITAVNNKLHTLNKQDHHDLTLIFKESLFFNDLQHVESFLSLQIQYYPQFYDPVLYQLLSNLTDSLKSFFFFFFSEFNNQQPLAILIKIYTHLCALWTLSLHNFILYCGLRRSFSEALNLILQSFLPLIGLCETLNNHVNNNNDSSFLKQISFFKLILRTTFLSTLNIACLSNVHIEIIFNSIHLVSSSSSSSSKEESSKHFPLSESVFVSSSKTHNKSFQEDFWNIFTLNSSRSTESIIGLCCTLHDIATSTILEKRKHHNTFQESYKNEIAFMLGLLDIICKAIKDDGLQQHQTYYYHALVTLLERIHDLNLFRPRDVYGDLSISAIHYIINNVCLNQLQSISNNDISYPLTSSITKLWTLLETIVIIEPNTIDIILTPLLNILSQHDKTCLQGYSCLALIVKKLSNLADLKTFEDHFKIFLHKNDPLPKIQSFLLHPVCLQSIVDILKDINIHKTLTLANYCHLWMNITLNYLNHHILHYPKGNNNEISLNNCLTLIIILSRILENISKIHTPLFLQLPKILETLSNIKEKFNALWEIESDPFKSTTLLDQSYQCFIDSLHDIHPLPELSLHALKFYSVVVFMNAQIHLYRLIDSWLKPECLNAIQSPNDDDIVEFQEACNTHGSLFYNILETHQLRTMLLDCLDWNTNLFYKIVVFFNVKHQQQQRVIKEKSISNNDGFLSEILIYLMKGVFIYFQFQRHYKNQTTTSFVSRIKYSNMLEILIALCHTPLLKNVLWPDVLKNHLHILFSATTEYQQQHSSSCACKDITVEQCLISQIKKDHSIMTDQNNNNNTDAMQITLEKIKEVLDTTFSDLFNAYLSESKPIILESTTTSLQQELISAKCFLLSQLKGLLPLYFRSTILAFISYLANYLSAYPLSSINGEKSHLIQLLILMLSCIHLVQRQEPHIMTEGLLPYENNDDDDHHHRVSQNIYDTNNSVILFKTSQCDSKQYSCNNSGLYFIDLIIGLADSLVSQTFFINKNVSLYQPLVLSINFIKYLAEITQHIVISDQTYQLFHQLCCKVQRHLKNTAPIHSDEINIPFIMEIRNLVAALAQTLLCFITTEFNANHNTIDMNTISHTKKKKMHGIIMPPLESNTTVTSKEGSLNLLLSSVEALCSSYIKYTSPPKRMTREKGELQITLDAFQIMSFQTHDVYSTIRLDDIARRAATSEILKNKLFYTLPYSNVNINISWDTIFTTLNKTTSLLKQHHDVIVCVLLEDFATSIASVILFDLERPPSHLQSTTTTNLISSSIRYQFINWILMLMKYINTDIGTLECSRDSKHYDLQEFIFFCLRVVTLIITKEEGEQGKDKKSKSQELNEATNEEKNYNCVMESSKLNNLQSTENASYFNERPEFISLLEHVIMSNQNTLVQFLYPMAYSYFTTFKNYKLLADFFHSTSHKYQNFQLSKTALPIHYKNNVFNMSMHSNNNNRNFQLWSLIIDQLSSNRICNVIIFIIEKGTSFVSILENLILFTSNRTALVRLVRPALHQEHRHGFGSQATAIRLIKSVITYGITRLTHMTACNDDKEFVSNILNHHHNDDQWVANHLLWLMEYSRLVRLSVNLHDTMRLTIPEDTRSDTKWFFTLVTELLTIGDLGSYKLLQSVRLLALMLQHYPRKLMSQDNLKKNIDFIKIVILLAEHLPSLISSAITSAITVRRDTFNETSSATIALQRLLYKRTGQILNISSSLLLSLFMIPLPDAALRLARSITKIWTTLFCSGDALNDAQQRMAADVVKVLIQHSFDNETECAVRSHILKEYISSLSLEHTVIVNNNNNNNSKVMLTTSKNIASEEQKWTQVFKCILTYGLYPLIETLSNHMKQYIFTTVDTASRHRFQKYHTEVTKFHGYKAQLRRG